MKKKLYIVATFIIMIMSVNYVWAANTGNIISEKAGFLEKLSIMSTKSISEEKKITREDFALYTARMLKIDTETTYSGERYFADVEHDGYAASAINGLASRGYVSGYGENAFLPQKNITVEEACSMVLNAMGYKQYAMKYNASSRFTQLAKELDIISYSISSKELTYAEAADILFNSMTTGLCHENIKSNSLVEYYEDEDKTILSEYWGIYFTEGTVTDLYGGSLEGDYVLGEKELILEKQRYTVDRDVDESGYLGSYVRIFYYSDEAETPGNIMFIMRDKQKTEEVVIDISLFKSFDTKELVYYSDKSASKSRKIKISKPTVVYNGFPLGSNVALVTDNLNKGTITVKDSDNDGTYDTVIFDDYRNFVVGNVDMSNESIYNLLDNSDSIKFDECDSVRLIDVDGDACDISTLSKYTILSVKRPVYDSVKAVTAVVSNEVFNGVIEAIGDDYVKVNGTEFEVDNGYFDILKENSSIGSAYYFRTDHLGNISYVNLDANDGDSFGYMMQKTYGVPDDIEGVYVTVLNEDGKISKLKLAKKIRIDAKSYKEYADMLKYLASQNGSIKNEEFIINAQLIKYSVNEDGEISVMDTLSVNSPKENNQNSLTARYTKEEEEEEKWFCVDRFGLKAVMNANTKVFYIPNSNKSAPQEEVCAVGKYTLGMASDSSYYGNAYYTSSLSSYADAVVVYYKAEHLKRYNAVVISEISKGVNEDNETVNIVSGYENGSFVEYEVDEDISLENVGVGDLVRFNYGFGGNIIKSQSGEDDVAVLYDFSEKKCVDWQNVTDTRTLWAVGTNQDNYRARPQFSFGYVSRKISDIVAWGNMPGKEYVEEASLQNVPIIICDSKKRDDKVYLGTIEDIIDYESAGADCDSVIFATDPRSLFAVIYR